MDPVCCLTCYPQLLNSFVYKTTTLNEAFGSLEGLANAVRVIFSRDLIIAEVVITSLILCFITYLIICLAFPSSF